MFDLLTQAEPKRSRPGVVLPAGPPEPDPVPTAETLAGLGADEEVPFIEVGDRATRSPAFTLIPQAAPPMPPLPAEPVYAPNPFAERPAAPRAPGVFNISFYPLPAEPEEATPDEHSYGPELIALHDPDHPVSEQYRSLRAELAMQLPDGAPRVILFSSAAAGAGTTTVVLNLAVTRAREAGAVRPRVAVVDLNWARPTVAERLGVPKAPGLREALRRTAPLPWALHRTGVEGLTVLPAGRGGEYDPAPPLALVPSVVEQLRERFDWVLIDGPAWGPLPELAAVAGACDAVYLVLRQAEVEQPEVSDLQTAIQLQGGRLRGYVLTDDA
jgi:Mrp family chromosome partitioning ATPase